MPKKIIFCADGTWNHPHQPAGVDPKDTNVFKIFNLVQQSSDQSTIYDDGVGADGLPLEHLVGGAFGVGLFDKIKQGYGQIAKNYQKGDAIYLFGFSRGAYTARAIAGMLTVCGLPTVNPPADIADRAFHAYFDRDDRPASLAALAPFGMETPRIAMQGMWDTVGALGITGPLFGISDPLVYGFIDTDLHENTDAAFHALAIDERRAEFKETLWEPTGRPDQILEQVWFAGVHSEVGGGSDEIGLSDITLSWMLRNAERMGLALTPAASQYHNIDPKHALDQMKDSWSLLWAFPRRRQIPAGATVANSVKIRLQHDDSYRPSNLVANGPVLDPGYQIENIVADPDAPVQVAAAGH